MTEDWLTPEQAQELDEFLDEMLDSYEHQSKVFDSLFTAFPYSKEIH